MTRNRKTALVQRPKNYGTFFYLTEIHVRKNTSLAGVLAWSGRQGSNLRPLGPEPSALPLCYAPMIFMWKQHNVSPPNNQAPRPGTPKPDLIVKNWYDIAHDHPNLRMNPDSHDPRRSRRDKKTRIQCGSGFCDKAADQPASSSHLPGAAGWPSWAGRALISPMGMAWRQSSTSSFSRSNMPTSPAMAKPSK